MSHFFTKLPATGIMIIYLKVITPKTGRSTLSQGQWELRHPEHRVILLTLWCPFSMQGSSVLYRSLTSLCASLGYYSVWCPKQGENTCCFCGFSVMFFSLPKSGVRDFSQGNLPFAGQNSAVSHPWLSTTGAIRNSLETSIIHSNTNESHAKHYAKCQPRGDHSATWDPLPIRLPSLFPPCHKLWCFLSAGRTAWR